MDHASHQKVFPGAGEVAEKLGVLTVFAEDSVSIASTRQLTTTPAPGDPTLFRPSWHPQVHGLHEYM